MNIYCLYSGDVNYCKVTLNTDDVSVGIVVGKLLFMPLPLSLYFCLLYIQAKGICLIYMPKA